ncbi:MAG: hypothetical protein QM695_03155 [Micropruina sp.]
MQAQVERIFDKGSVDFVGRACRDPNVGTILHVDMDAVREKFGPRCLERTVLTRRIAASG